MNSAYFFTYGKINQIDFEYFFVKGIIKRKIKKYTIKKYFNKRKSLIECLNKLIDYSMGFPFYQGLNPLLNGKSNKDTPLSSDRRRARAGPWGGVGPLGPPARPGGGGAGWGGGGGGAGGFYCFLCLLCYYFISF